MSLILPVIGTLSHQTTLLGKGLIGKTAPWLNANGLNDVSKISSETVLEKLQSKEVIKKLNS